MSLWFACFQRECKLEVVQEDQKMTSTCFFLGGGGKSPCCLHWWITSIANLELSSLSPLGLHLLFSSHQYLIRRARASILQTYLSLRHTPQSFCPFFFFLKHHSDLKHSSNFTFSHTTWLLISPDAAHLPGDPRSCLYSSLLKL